MQLTYSLGAASMGYLLLYRYRLQELALHLKNAGRSRKAASGWKDMSGPQLALVISLVARSHSVRVRVEGRRCSAHALKGRDVASWRRSLNWN